MLNQARETHEIRHLIDGRWSGGGGVERRNPADVDDLVSTSPAGTAAEMDQAVSAATTAQRGWAQTSPAERGKIIARASQLLGARAEEVAIDLCREEGKTLAEATGEVARAVDVLAYYGGEGWRLTGDVFPSAVASTMVYTRHEPLGVVGVVTPWNFPIAIPSWKIAPALVSGNAVVFKPASLTPVSAMHLVNALVDAGLPDGVLNLVFGSGGEVGMAMVGDDRVAAVTFTGSTEVGRRIEQKAAERGARVQLEMGGKNPLVVLDDADPETAARVAAVGGFGLTGQACTATSRVICTHGIAASFVEALAAEAERFVPGNGLEPGVMMGPVVSEQQLETDRSYLEVAVSEGARAARTHPGGEGLFFGPTVFVGVEPHHRIAQEEVFGPIIGVIEAADFDQALEIANGTEYGLSAGIVTNDLARAQKFAERIQAGVVKVNRPTTGLDLNVPFGGIRASSTGTFREQGPTAVEFFTWSKTVYLGWD
jgi:aldehyde dehydrogenase (NAD+)